ncbi:MAG: hypothetical protein IJU78_03375, partial [Clostridia bacterium]|nr:hypothetical protein [Clostridia bacterium]
MKGNASKLLSVFLALVMMAGLLPLSAQAEERTKVTNIVATSNTSSIAIYGSEIRVPTFNITTGNEAHFATANGGWLKKNGDSWERCEGVFSAGIWKYCTQIRIDERSGYGATHVLDASATVKVDGVNWAFEGLSISDSYSMAWVTSPEFVIEETIGDELVFYSQDGELFTVGKILRSEGMSRTAGGTGEPDNYGYDPDNISMTLRVSGAGSAAEALTALNGATFERAARSAGGNIVFESLTLTESDSSSEDERILSYTKKTGEIVPV